MELTRDICRRFNDQYCKKRRNTFREPAALIVKEGARVMSLQGDLYTLPFDLIPLDHTHSLDTH